jgi:RNA polymerase sigma-70 factor (ECF subfamily)
MSSQPPWDWESHRALLRMFARQLRWHPRMRTRFDSSDLVQDALLRAYQGRAGFTGRTVGELVKWLQSILRNTYCERLAREGAKKRDPCREKDLQAALDESNAGLERFLAAPSSSPEERLEREELLLRLARALEQLPEDQRDAVICRYLNGQTVAETAAQFGKTDRSISGLLLRGLQRLRALMGAEGGLTNGH